MEKQPPTERKLWRGLGNDMEEWLSRSDYFSIFHRISQWLSLSLQFVHIISKMR